MLTATIITTATHAVLLSVVAKTAKVSNGVKEIGKKRLKAREAHGRLENVDDVFHY